MIWAHQCEMKPLFFELPTQTHPASCHQLHLRHVVEILKMLVKKMLIRMVIFTKICITEILVKKMLITSFLTAATMVTTKQVITTSCFIVNYFFVTFPIPSLCKLSRSSLSCVISLKSFHKFYFARGSMRILLRHSLMYFLHSLIDCRPRFCLFVSLGSFNFIHTSLSVWVTHNCSGENTKIPAFQLFDATISIGLEALLQKSALLTFDWIEVLIQTHCGKNLDVAWPRRIVWTQLESVTSTEVPQWLPQNSPVLCDDERWSESLHAVTTPSGCRLIREQKIVWTSGILRQAGGNQRAGRWFRSDCCHQRPLILPLPTTPSSASIIATYLL